MLTIKTAASAIRSSERQVFYLASKEFRKEAELEQDFDLYVEKGTIPPYVSAFLDVMERRLGIRRT